jgi:hypothetical protein
LSTNNQQSSPSRSDAIKFVTLFTALVIVTPWAAIRFLYWIAEAYRIDDIRDALPVLALIAFLAVSTCYALINLYGIALVLILPHPKLVRLQKWAARYPITMCALNMAIANKLKEYAH